MDNFTVAGKNKGMIIASKLLPANLQFFGFADKNQMPISRVSIDWDDASPPLSLEGMYQNRKPYCSSGSTKDSAANVCSVTDNLTCQSDADCPSPETCVKTETIPAHCGDDTTKLCTTDAECVNFGTTAADKICTPQSVKTKGFHFGNSPEACSTEPFSFTHTYTYPKPSTDNPQPSTQCQPLSTHSRLTPTEKATIKFSGATDTSTVCVFIPKVQLLDNWGWCNGKKADGTYEKYWNEKTDPGETEPKYLCGKDSDDLKKNITDAWTLFKGKVILLP